MLHGVHLLERTRTGSNDMTMPEYIEFGLRQRLISAVVARKLLAECKPDSFTLRRELGQLAKKTEPCIDLLPPVFRMPTDYNIPAYEGQYLLHNQKLIPITTLGTTIDYQRVVFEKRDSPSLLPTLDNPSLDVTDPTFIDESFLTLVKGITRNRKIARFTFGLTLFDERMLDPNSEHQDRYAAVCRHFELGDILQDLKDWHETRKKLSLVA